MNKKAVRAIAYYNSIGNSDSLMHLRISSFYFDSTVTSNDTTFLYGIYERLDSDSHDDPIGNAVICMRVWTVLNQTTLFDKFDQCGAGVSISVKKR